MPMPRPICLSDTVPKVPDALVPVQGLCQYPLA